MTSEPSITRVLIIDDDDLICTTMRLILEPEYHVTTSITLAEARGELLKQGAYDAILCDMMLGDGTGAALYAWSKVHAPGQLARMIFMTGGSYTDEARLFFSDSSVKHLQKPFALQELIDAIEAIDP